MGQISEALQRYAVCDCAIEVELKEQSDPLLTAGQGNSDAKKRLMGDEKPPRVKTTRTAQK
jgi:hypothetical protein